MRNEIKKYINLKSSSSAIVAIQKYNMKLYWEKEKVIIIIIIQKYNIVIITGRLFCRFEYYSGYFKILLFFIIKNIYIVYT